MSRKLLREVEQGVISPKQGAEVAQQLRNEIMAASRLRSTPVGRAWAEQLKRDGKTLDALLDHYARKHFQRPSRS